MYHKEETFLEGILKNTCSSESAQFLLVFRDTFFERRHASRLAICASKLSIEWSPGTEILYEGRSAGLKDYEATNKSFFELMKSNLVECLEKGKLFSPDLIWYEQLKYVVSSTPDTNIKPATLDQLMA